MLIYSITLHISDLSENETGAVWRSRKGHLNLKIKILVSDYNFLHWYFDESNVQFSIHLSCKLYIQYYCHFQFSGQIKPFSLYLDIHYLNFCFKIQYLNFSIFWTNLFLDIHYLNFCFEIQYLKFNYIFEIQYLNLLFWNSLFEPTEINLDSGQLFNFSTSTNM